MYDEENVLSEMSKLLCDKIQQIAPLHYHSMSCSPISTVFNDCRFLYNQQECEKFVRDKHYFSKICFWATVSYKEMKQTGLSQYFVEKAVDFLVRENFIKKKRLMGGNKYAICDNDYLESTVKHNRKYIEISQFEYNRIKDLDWIFNEFSDLEINEIFETNKRLAIDDTKNNIDFIDSVNFS